MVKLKYILKKGAKLKARKLPNTKEVQSLIQQTIEAQKKVLCLKEIDYNKLRNEIITI